MPHRRILLTGTLLCLIACNNPTTGGSSGSSLGLGVTPPPQPLVPDGTVTVALDIGTVARSSTSAEPSPPTPGQTALVFAALPSVTAALGSQPDELGQEVDEAPQAQVPVPASTLATTELTRAQWFALAGTRPWQRYAGAGVGAEIADDRLPATGFSRDELLDVLARFNARGLGYRLELPSSAAWEAACRSGTTTPYAWGSDEDPAIVARYARVRETLAETGGGEAPRPVALGEPNLLGLFDAHGNVWELTADTNALGEAIIRGGSWADNLLSARSANLQSVPSDLPHPLVGARLVLVRDP